MIIKVPELALVVLIGASGSGKSTLARRLFKPTEVLSSDTCRGWVSDDENNQLATGDAFDVLQFIARKRLARGLLTVVDATNVRAEDRQEYVHIAREYHCLPVAIVLDTPEHLCHNRNRTRPDRAFGPHVVRQQRMALRRELRHLEREGFRHVYILRTPEECQAATLVREPLWNNRKHDHGPFDIIGDVHGCYDELITLLGELGWSVVQRAGEPEGVCDVQPPVGDSGDPRKPIFLGDLVDRGPKTPAVLRLVMSLTAGEQALCVPGNHDIKLMRALRGKKVEVAHGLAESLAQLAGEPQSFREQVVTFVDDLVSHYVLAAGEVVVAHAGMKESMQGRGSRAVRDFALYGETTGETDEFGLPVRHNWAAEYRGRAAVVYGHTPVPDVQWLNNTANVDTGCVFGGSLTALRWPERTIHSVPARAIYAEPRKPFLPAAQPVQTLQQLHDDVLNIADVSGKRHVETALFRIITIRQENAAAALEVMSRFAIDPRWLIYLPPTMAPAETSQDGEFLEHRREAFEHYRTSGIGRVICEAKHMGSRAVVILCREPAVSRQRFGIHSAADGTLGTIYTRTGRPFFADTKLERALLQRVHRAVGRVKLWDELNTDWLCLDAELMPWSAKAQALIRDQYATVGAAARVAMHATTHALALAAQRNPDAATLLLEYQARSAMVNQYTQAYRGYCWDVHSVDDLRLAPFHLLASEGKVHANCSHDWHMHTLTRLAEQDAGVLTTTRNMIVDLSSHQSEAAATAWWLEHTAAGGEGMVVKPLEFIARGPRGLVQPATKVRGQAYLRIIYGPEYTRPENLTRLRARRLGSKRALALREFALGLEALERFVRREPLRRVHECVFGVLALESEPVDPKL